MLLRFAIKATFLVCAPLAALILLSVPTDQEPDIVQEFFDTPEDCAPPCWLGIRPGETDVDEALRTLRGHPWVRNVQTSFNIDLRIRQPINGYITWHWSIPELQHLMPGGGWMDISRSQVRAVRLVTTATFGEMWLAIGQPDEGSLRPSGAFGELYAVHQAIYRERGLMLRSLVPYPIKMYPYWHGPVEVFIQANIARETRYRQPCWLAC